MRAHFLSTIHPLRNDNGGWVPTSDMNFGGFEPVTLERIRTVCEQLAEAGLIVFRLLPGGPDGGFVGMSTITGHGCDVVEGVRPSRIGASLGWPTIRTPQSTAGAELLTLKPSI